MFFFIPPPKARILSDINNCELAVRTVSHRSAQHEMKAARGFTFFELSPTSLPSLRSKLYLGAVNLTRTPLKGPQT